ncbi:HEL019Cp [Eremothecium sinecaudum]|uniref:HEL019Cp n=1 Tax=Eremothecium sinecaudum TaxID=45286 RepID=A0A0X8HTN8_9SACH|nr:HEL019Cp [Eremothecium sinecaudum]AMD21261.1 HEL019Cp [Eremothecium sinecaudum]
MLSCDPNVKDQQQGLGVNSGEKSQSLQQPFRSHRGLQKKNGIHSIPSTDCGHNVEYILSAEFDNKSGAMIKHQYPKNLPKLKHQTSNLANLAALMIPNGIENRPGESDFTVFILYRDRYSQTFSLFPPTEASISRNSTGSYGAAGSSPSRLGSVILEEDEHAGISTTSLASSKKDLLFFLNVVHSEIDYSNERGAVIKSLAVGTVLQNFFIFKPLLMMALDAYMKSPSMQILKDCFDLINSLDLSLMVRIHSNKLLQNVLNSINNDEIIHELLDPQGKALKKLLRVSELPETDKNGNSIAFKQSTLIYRFDNFKPIAVPHYFTRIPIHINMIKYNDIEVDINYKDHVVKFLSAFIPHLSKLPRDAPPWRLMINSMELSTDSLCQLVLALSNFIHAFEHKYIRNGSVVVFPYMDISMVDDLRYELSQPHSSELYFIVGVSNPIFELQKNVWDVYYNLDTGILISQSSPNTAPSHRTSTGSLHHASVRSSDFLMKIFSKTSNSVTSANESLKMGLLQKFMQYTMQQQHDNQTVLNVFKRVTILQLIHLLPKLGNDVSISTDMLLTDEYMLTYKDFVIFPEFFEYSSLRVIRLLNDMEKSLHQAFFPHDKSKDSKERVLLKIYCLLKEIYKFICLDKTHLSTFLNVCLNYPTTRAFDQFDLRKADFSKINLTKVLRHELRNLNGADGVNYTQANVIDYLSVDKGLGLLFYPLLLYPVMDVTTAGLYPTSSKHSSGSSNTFPRSVEKGLSLDNSKTSASTFSFPDGNLTMVTKYYEQFLENNLVYNTRDDLSITSNQISDCPYMVDRIRKLALKLLMRLERHHIGQLLIDKKLNPIFPMIYRTLKREAQLAVSPIPNHSNDSSLTKDVSKSSPFPAASFNFADNAPVLSPQIESHNLPLSANRQELLQDLKLISSRNPHDSKSTDLSSKSSKSDLIDSLTRLELYGIDDWKYLDSPANVRVTTKSSSSTFPEGPSFSSIYSIHRDNYNESIQ